MTLGREHWLTASLQDKLRCPGVSGHVSLWGGPASSNSWGFFLFLVFFFKIYASLNYVYVYLYRSMCLYVQVPLEDVKRESDFLELELQAIVSHLKWALGTDPRSSGKVTHALNHWATLTTTNNWMVWGLGFYLCFYDSVLEIRASVPCFWDFWHLLTYDLLLGLFLHQCNTEVRGTPESSRLYTQTKQISETGAVARGHLLA